MSKWVGYAVSVNCGEPLGCYQGTILEADGNTITLTKAFRNGFPYPKSKVTLNAADIKDLKIIEAQTEPVEQSHSTVAVTKNNKKGQRATVCENLQANPSSLGNQVWNSSTNKSGCARVSSVGAGPTGSSGGGVLARSKPIDIQGTRNNKNNNHTGSFGNSGSTPKARGGEKARRRNEACFGSEAEPALTDDFDFEGNLALFDKAGLWERMRSTKPDLVRAAEGPTRYRHDEPVLPAPPPVRAPVRLPDHLRGPIDYVTDEGVVVPSVVSSVRRSLWSGLWAHPWCPVLCARAAADVALRLAGGGRRLEPRNAHQAPTAVALVGAHRAGSLGLAAVRLLHSHGVRVAALVAGSPAAAADDCAPLRRELLALRQATGRAPHAAAEDLPNPDIVILALYDLHTDDDQDVYEEALSWAKSARAAIVAIEPPEAGWAGVSARASVVAGLPGALPTPAPSALGRLYLANVAPPPQLFADLAISYRPPFGAHSVLPLHPADD